MMSWISTLRTSAEDLGTLPENEPPTESEIISWDASLRMDGIRPLHLWDLIVTGDLSTSLTRKKIPGNTDDLNSVDFVFQTNSSHKEAMLCIFEDNEAVIKMIIKGRSPTMRHVSRTHRVALDWWFDRINLDPKIQIKYVDTKKQLADILTEVNFTRDEWNHLLCLFNISHFSSMNKFKAMSKRTQEDASE